MDTPWEKLAASAKHKLLHARTKGYKGILPFLADLEDKKYKQYIRVFLRQYQTAQECPECHGTKLQAEALQVRVAGRNIAEVSELPVDRLLEWLESLELRDFERQVASHILKEARDRVQFLCDVGLNYLTMNRATRTLSGGEAQRIGLANSLGSQLVDTLYVLDEPSIGLHPRDMDRLLRLLHRLRETGNTVLVVEHDPEAIRAADYMVELGPASGEKGGQLVFAGPIDAAAKPADRRVSDRRARDPRARRAAPARAPLDHAHRRARAQPQGRRHQDPARRRDGRDRRFRIWKEHTHTRCAAPGPRDALARRARRQAAPRRKGRIVRGLTGVEAIDDVVSIDQSPIGKSPRSNPVTYVKAFDEIRRIFADAPLARERRYNAGTFSFNVAGGRCETCEGAGFLEVEMVFMADVFVPCDDCGGKRFKPAVLDVRVHGKNIYEVLELTIDEAIRFFPREEKLGQALWQLQQVGLGYLRLGQPATTLSGGEAQRLKVARELVFTTKKTGKKLYVMDEPTTGLHLDDIRKLAQVFDRLVDAGHTLVLIEHNLDVIKLADWVIDLGPEAGDRGGEVVATGRPEDVARTEGSHTGEWLRTVLPGFAEHDARRPRRRASREVVPQAV